MAAPQAVNPTAPMAAMADAFTAICELLLTHVRDPRIANDVRSKIKVISAMAVPETPQVSAPLPPQTSAPVPPQGLSHPQKSLPEEPESQIPLAQRSGSPSPMSEYDSDSSSQSRSSDSDSSYGGNATGGKRKMKGNSKLEAAPAAKKTAVKASSPPALPTTPSAPVSRPASPVDNTQQASRPHSPMAIAAPAAPLPRKLSAPPPLFIHDKGKWTDVSTACNERRIKYSNARAVQAGIKVTVPTATDYRELHRLLVARNIPFHSFAFAEEKQTRAVVRNVPREIPVEDIRRDLESQNIPVAQVHRMHRRGGAAYDMVLVVCDPTVGHHPIFALSKICGLSGLKVETPSRSGIVGQCHRCQLYGHSQRNCHGKPRCVKCLGDHGTSDCPRPKDRTQCDEPPSCVLCGESGHPANYRGCPKAPKSSAPKLAKRANARQLRECPTLSRALPATLSPQRPNPWTGNHKAHFPALRAAAPQAPQATSAALPAQPAAPPKAIPALMDVAVPPFSPPMTTRATLGSRPVLQAPPTTPKVVSGGDVTRNIILVTYNAFYSPRALAMARALEGCRGDHASVFAQFSDVVRHVETYTSLHG